MRSLFVDRGGAGCAKLFQGTDLTQCWFMWVSHEFPYARERVLIILNARDRMWVVRSRWDL
jgi:hypothetical protein